MLVLVSQRSRTCFHFRLLLLFTRMASFVGLVHCAIEWVSLCSFLAFTDTALSQTPKTGSIVGRIYNSPTYVDGDVVWTSPITQGTVQDNSTVSTESGSRYYLSSAPSEEPPTEDTKEVDEPIAVAAPAPSATLKNTNTMRVTPENLAAVLRGITGAVSELENSLGLSGEGADGIVGSAVVKPSSSPKKTKIDVVLGAQWGDEGKGKLVDMLSQVSSSSGQGRRTLRDQRRGPRTQTTH